MYKLGLEKAEESEIKMPAFTGSWRKQGNSRKVSTSVSLNTLKPLTVWITTKWGKFLEKWSTSHLICLQKNLYTGQEAIVRTLHGTTDWFKIGKGVQQGCIFSHCLFNFYTEYITWNAGLDESQVGIKMPGWMKHKPESRLLESRLPRNTNNLRYADDTTLMAESNKEPLDEGKGGEWKTGLKLNIQNIKIMASGLITSCQIEGKK